MGFLSGLMRNDLDLGLPVEDPSKLSVGDMLLLNEELQMNPDDGGWDLKTDDQLQVTRLPSALDARFEVAVLLAHSYEPQQQAGRIGYLKNPSNLIYWGHRPLVT